MSLLLRKLYLYFTKDPDESIIFQGGGGVQLFPGDKCLFRLGPIFVLAIFQGGGGRVRTPYPPLDPHMGNVIITGHYLSQSRF